MEKYENRQECPIGVFDSGVGGISVLRELVAQMPNENYIFFGAVSYTHLTLPTKLEV